MRHFDLRNGVSLSDEIKGRGIDLLGEIPFPLTQDRFDFSSSCMPLYEKHYPEIIAEIVALSKGLKINENILFALFFSMYAIVPMAHCSCIAVRDDENVFLGRNSDFYTRIKELNSHFIYDDYYGNSTAFLELEDGRNSAGLHCDKNWGIGKHNSLMFRQPKDRAFFWRTTKDKTVVMGTNTLLSLLRIAVRLFPLPSPSLECFL